MRKITSVFCLFTILIFVQNSFAQDYTDCDKAFKLCGESPFLIGDADGTSIGLPDTGLDTTCLPEEREPVWRKWTVVQGGILTFVLTPQSEDQDLDFLVYRSNTTNACHDKELVRCMATGSIGGGWGIDRCMGETGLAVGETDTVETEGCLDEDNNFLAPLEVNFGEEYVMLVNEFASLDLGFMLDFGGTAELDCITMTSVPPANYTDCDEAFAPCGESPFFIGGADGLSIGLPDAGVDASCVMQEYEPVWIEWNVNSGGLLTFVLTPQNDEQDLDFLVYKFNTDNNCDDKELIRCMATGAGMEPTPDEIERCGGATGLMLGETDVEEMLACSAGDNNFLAPLETNSGDRYVMLVNDFGGSDLGFTLDFGGTSELDCITMTTVPTIDLENNESSLFHVFPSISQGLFSLEIDEKLLDSELYIYNTLGCEVYSNPSIKNKQQQINLTNMPNGVYMVVVKKDNHISSKRIFVRE